MSDDPYELAAKLYRVVGGIIASPVPQETAAAVARATAVVDRFDDAKRARLSAEGMSAAWSQVVAAVGAFDHGGETRVSRASGFTITTTPLRFEQDERTARISVWDDGRIAGLFILAGSPS